MCKRSWLIGETLDIGSYRRSIKVEVPQDDGLGVEGAGSDLRGLTFIPEYRVYNRERELERQEREKKELQWEEELNSAMMGAEERLRRVPPSGKIINNQLISYVCITA